MVKTPTEHSEEVQPPLAETPSPSTQTSCNALGLGESGDRVCVCKVSIGRGTDEGLTDHGKCRAGLGVSRPVA